MKIIKIYPLYKVWGAVGFCVFVYIFIGEGFDLKLHFQYTVYTHLLAFDKFLLYFEWRILFINNHKSINLKHYSHLELRHVSRDYIY